MTALAKTKLIILDRDGVINQDSDHFVKSVDEFIPIPGSLDAIAQLCQAGFKVVVATNQSGIARELFSPETLTAMHDKLQRLLAPLSGHIARFYFCPHGPADSCDCRKPKPGLIQQIARDFLDSPEELSNVFVIGDSLRDLDAGLSAGARVALVKTGKGKRSLDKIRQDQLTQYSNIPVFTDLAEFTQQFLNQSNERFV
jgi:D-glycero-D-manno-heptose 1,7-bisphosphate phosphatase